MPATHRRKYRVLLSCLLILIGTAAISQEQYATGITIDPEIEKVCRSKKNLNSFTVARYVNDSLDANPILGFLGKLPLTAVVSTRDKDTTITFMNMLVPQGFQLQFKNDSCVVEVFVSSKSCKCYKSNLTDSTLRYGAGAKPGQLILVLSKRHDLQTGDEIFGYIKTTGGTLYHRSNPGDEAAFDRWRHEYEGYFRFVLRDTFGN